MLPDFIPLKKKISRQLISYLRRKVRYADPFIRQIRHKTQHEGNRQVMRTYDGYTDEFEYESLGSHFSIPTEEIVKDGVSAFKKYIDKLADDILGQESKMIFRKLNEITSKTGNVVETGGQPFTPERLLEALEKIQVDFDENGQPANLKIVMSPDLWEKIKDKITVWQADPEFRKKHEVILEKKRREWRDRENNRKLVD